MEAIPNGFDLEQVKPSASARVSVREELGIPENAPLIGMVARFHPHKDHRNFVRAAELLSKQIRDVHFLLCGIDVTWQNSQLAEWIEFAGIRERCHLLGLRGDVSRLFAAMDIATTASRSEAFPVVIGEAMGCGTPCVVTDVGDSAMMVDQTGIVVAPGNPAALAEAWRKLIDAGPEVRRRLGMAARQRVQQNFALPAIVDRYQAIYEKLAAKRLQNVPSPKLSECAR